jgi:tRNA dimethylallyltransferase
LPASGITSGWIEEAMNQNDTPAIAIVGMTASGKTALGMALARRFSGEIITCDALQVYRHMDIGTAKPGAHDRSLVAHHLLDLREPCDDFSAGDYLRLARQALAGIRERGTVPFVIGGTGLYLRALIEGLFDGPGRSEALRVRMRTIAAQRGPAAIHRALRRVDPEAAARLAPADLERNIRAYEIYGVSGRTMTWWQSQARDRLLGYRWLKLGISWPRPLLYERINRRVEAMFAAGFVAEVASLMTRYPRDCHAFKAIGYRQIARHLAGERSLQDALEDTQQESRRYAKRQATWFRSDPEIIWLDAMRGENAVLDKAAGIVEEYLSR